MATELITCIGIGLLFASLICLAIVPLVHCRAVRLTTRRLEASLPQSMAEIQASKSQAEPTTSSNKMTEHAKLLLLAPNFGQPLLGDTWTRGEPMSDASLIPTTPDGYVDARCGRR